MRVGNLVIFAEHFDCLVDMPRIAEMHFEHRVKIASDDVAFLWIGQKFYHRLARDEREFSHQFPPSALQTMEFDPHVSAGLLNILELHS